mmetsp:Transcript_51604/g.85584  ORF Transcript_51604/g.85584 Transcript_51604/m.85584 type:complete len:203 (-) Transcript_51604:140-748(-)
MGDTIDDVVRALADRASDLQRTLASSTQTDKLRSWSSALSHFLQLAQEIQVLHDKGSDPLLQYYVAQPLAITDDPSAIPALLSTRRNAEQEAEQEQQALSAKADQELMLSEVAVQQHNECLDAACRHLAVAAGDLPGAAALRAERERISATSSTTKRYPTSSPLSQDATAATAVLSALRTGEGVRPGLSISSGIAGAKRQRI